MTTATVASTRRHAAARWAFAAGGVATVGMLLVRDPNQVGSYGFCPLRALTGLDCPFCGGLRGSYALIHGDVATALDHNALLPLFLGVAALLGVSVWMRAGRPRPSSGPTPSLVALPVALWWTVGIASALFFVVRNLPWFPYLGSGA